MGKFAASIECSKTKSASATGGFAPLSSTRGSASEPHWKLCKQTAVIGSRYYARHGHLAQELQPSLTTALKIFVFVIRLHIASFPDTLFKVEQRHQMLCQFGIPPYLKM